MYTVYDPDGNLLLRQTYDYVTARPRLAIDAEGKLGVAGGVRHESSTDFPAPKEPPLEVELGLGTNGVPAGTNSVPATNSPPASTNGPAAHP
jgi:hypothetical protein